MEKAIFTLNTMNCSEKYQAKLPRVGFAVTCPQSHYLRCEAEQLARPSAHDRVSSSSVR